MVRAEAVKELIDDTLRVVCAPKQVEIHLAHVARSQLLQVRRVQLTALIDRAAQRRRREEPMEARIELRVAVADVLQDAIAVGCD